MTVAERLSREQVFHDQQARVRSITYERCPEQLRLDDDAYLDHETWIRPAFAELEPLRGRSLLDFGCGHGMASVVLARRGAKVTAFDLSSGYLQEAHHRAAANHATVAFVQADGARLPFGDASFDRIWGNAALHHLDIDLAGVELRRVLRPHGVAVFCEPWGGNWLLNCARRHLPYPGKQRTADERPLNADDLSRLRRVFPTLRIQGVQLLSMARRLWRNGRLPTTLDWCDHMLLDRVPVLQRFCRYVILTLPKIGPVTVQYFPEGRRKCS